MNHPIELDVASEGFLTWLSLERGRSRRTIDSYRRDLTSFARWCADNGCDPASASTGELERYLADRRQAGNAPSTVARAAATLRGVSAFRAREYGAVDAAAALEPGRVSEPIPKALERDEVTRLLDAIAPATPADRRDLALLEVLYGTGMRVSEAVGMSCSDLDLDARLVRVMGKGQRERVVPLGRPADRAVRSWLDPDARGSMISESSSRDDRDAVFLSQRGRRLTRQGAWLVVVARAAAVGLGDKVSPHVMRHSCATHMLEGGADIRVVQELLGHRSITTTQRYTRVAVDHMLSVYAEAHPRARLRSGQGTHAS